MLIIFYSCPWTLFHVERDTHAFVSEELKELSNFRGNNILQFSLHKPMNSSSGRARMRIHQGNLFYLIPSG